MYTTRSDRPLDPETLAILEALHTIAAKYDASYFIMGATARDILMNHVFGIKPGRATRDVDCAVALANWNEFEVIKKEFVESGQFQTAEGETHRLYFQQDKFGLAYPLDLIPFGAIESKGNTIAWPPDMAVVMNVIGYPEALKSAVQVDVGNGLVVDVISIPALAALKLLAWNDRGLADNKDAQDLFFLLRHYHEAGNFDRLYEQGFALLEAAGFDVTRAGAALLGFDVKLILEEKTRAAIFEILSDSVKRDRLAIQMDRSLGATAEGPSSLLSQFKLGLALPGL